MVSDQFDTDQDSLNDLEDSLKLLYEGKPRTEAGTCIMRGHPGFPRAAQLVRSYLQAAMGHRALTPDDYEWACSEVRGFMDRQQFGAQPRDLSEHGLEACKLLVAVGSHEHLMAVIERVFVADLGLSRKDYDYYMNNFRGRITARRNYPSSSISFQILEEVMLLVWLARMPNWSAMPSLSVSALRSYLANSSDNDEADNVVTMPQRCPSRGELRGADAD